ncbi:MAG: hypothetical protein R3F61_01520 [Myxococcota bacterium]
MERWLMLVTAAMVGCSSLPGPPRSTAPEGPPPPLDPLWRARALVSFDGEETHLRDLIGSESDRRAFERICKRFAAPGEPCEISTMWLPQMAQVLAKTGLEHGPEDELNLHFTPQLLLSRDAESPLVSPLHDGMNAVVVLDCIVSASRGNCGTSKWFRVDPRDGRIFDVQEWFGGCAGRPMPPGHRRSYEPGLAANVERWMALAADEDEAVRSFRAHLVELEHLGAPQSLRARARRALHDEIRHRTVALREASRLAGRTLALGPLPARAPGAPRTDRLDILLSVARDGAINETLSLCELGAWSASGCEQAGLLAGIARDEARHAALAWDTLRWAWPTLDAADRSSLLSILRAAPQALSDRFVPLLEHPLAA